MRAVIVSQLSLTERDVDRFGFACFRARGWSVCYADVGRLIFPSKPDAVSVPVEGVERVVCRTKSEWAAFRPAMADADLIVCIVGAGHWDAGNARILGDICRAGTPYLMLFCNAIPAWNFSSLADPWKRFMSRLSHFDPVKSLVSRVPGLWLGIRPADYAVYGGRASRVTPPMIGPETRAILAHAYDYDHYLAHASEPRAQENIGVFIDQHLGLHPDVAAMGLTQPFDAADYYPRLNTYFDRIEQATGLEIVIAAHPRSRYPGAPDLFAGRKVLYGQTGDLLRRAKVAFTSFSTAVNLAVIYEVPLVFVGPRSLIDHPYYGLLMKQMAEMLGRPVVSVSDDPDADGADLFSIDRDKYRRYREDFVKQPGTEEKPLWDIVLGTIGR